MMKLKHFESRGRRQDSDVQDARLPLNNIIHDKERDCRDRTIVGELGMPVNQCKSCNDFKADPSDSRCGLLPTHCNTAARWPAHVIRVHTWRPLEAYINDARG